MNEFNELGGVNLEDLGIKTSPEAATSDKAEIKELNETQQIKQAAFTEATRSAKTVDEKGIILPSMSMKNDLEMKGTGFGG